MAEDERGTLGAGPGQSMRRLLDGFSLEMTGKDVPALEEAAELIPPGTRINITFLGNEDQPLRVAAAAAARRLGFTPVPHISARRLASQQELEQFLDALAAAAAPKDVFAVAGDPAQPLGPYEDSLALIRSGLLGSYGIEHVGISGYPEGHPDISNEMLWRALADKYAALQDLGLESSIITQFGFDADPVLDWLAELRLRGIGAPVRIGVPGPAGIKRLLSYARRFGVASSAGIVHKYGFSLTNLLGTAGPDKYLGDVAERQDRAGHGRVLAHFYTFGGLKPTAEWVRDVRHAG
ncbi:methylenetetrahydrofolate reductase [Arthrobacter sp. I2-34]|uniref:Methylenetetrahydrofolate reductase n=1 Tax=Arthrobacter hankyongi TaxID=2904801 RepID=A0ABS9L2S2_9MICC|nr:methylenetetrahydrofolate reductase [Arthrobacter hankyongi]MCG2620935.1 methylenetetrahydrofolate reductase [Arthrobacter hankyongi]